MLSPSYSSEPRDVIHHQFMWLTLIQATIGKIISALPLYMATRTTRWLQWLTALHQQKSNMSSSASVSVYTIISWGITTSNSTLIIRYTVMFLWWYIYVWRNLHLLENFNHLVDGFLKYPIIHNKHLKWIISGILKYSLIYFCKYDIRSCVTWNIGLKFKYDW